MTKYIRYIFFVLIIMLAALYVSTNWYQLVLVHGESMKPSYQNMQFVIIDKHSGIYTYNDVIAFKCDSLDSILIKRIAACPGDEVVIKNGILYTNDLVSTVFPENYYFVYAGIAQNTVRLKAGQYFVIGDNIENSRDSRYTEIGCINNSAILGKVIK